MKEKWTEIIRRKLEGHRLPPPEGLWESISEQMGLPPEAPRHPAWGKRWSWAAAAAILALTGLFAYYLHDFSNPSSPTANVAPSGDKPLAPTPAKPTLAVVQTDKQQPMPETNQPDMAKPEPQTVNRQPSTLNRQPPTVNPQPPTVNPQPPTVNNETEQLYQPKTEPDGQKQEKAALQPVSPPTESIRHTSQQSQWKVGIHASGGLLAANSSTPSQMVENSYIGSAFHMPSKSLNGIVCVSYETNQHKHHPPMRFGLSMNYQLSDRLALLSGINYTWLYSEFYSRNDHSDQHLHYLGLPVGVAYQLWSSRRFQVYLSGSVMLEKCLNEKPWQWSADAGAGAEFALTDQLGLYIEPSVGYYFNDGTDIEHYYKDHPLAPSIMLGLRMHIKPSGK